MWREWKDWKDWGEWWGSASSATSARLVEMMEKWCIFSNSLLLIRSAMKDWGDQLVWFYCILLTNALIIIIAVFPSFVSTSVGRRWQETKRRRVAHRRNHFWWHCETIQIDSKPICRGTHHQHLFVFQAKYNQLLQEKVFKPWM